jgi:prophage regulatory protein
MRLLSKKQVREKVLYSPAHIARLEAAGSFPKRIRLGQGRVGWLEAEIEDWIAARVAERDRTTPSL